MAVPKRKKSRSRTRSRRAQWKAAPLTLVACDNCGQTKVPHHLCENCGTYDRRQVVEV
ncbi:50S ribosomal protein L32 [Catenulispora yoronensis]|uniref:Large ribosomal subunit protein bL32 n=1 Tax=Catenulispora yoronensis TaxID=450799 RepID=A0ABN2V9Z4_9ACTN